MYSIVFYVPESHLKTVKQAMFDQGAGDYGHYDNCCWQVKGSGQFRPLEGSSPFIGKTAQIEELPEFRVEMICKDELLIFVLEAMLKAHPYETPAYMALKISTLEDL